MRIVLAILLIIAVAVACGRVVHAEARITLLSRTQDGLTVRVAYLVESAAPVAVVATGQSATDAVEDGAGGYRTTVKAVLSACQGRLTIDGTEVVGPMRCVWLPKVAR